MICIVCGGDTKVVSSRGSDGKTVFWNAEPSRSTVVVRIRKCVDCGCRFRTEERHT